MGNKIYLCLMCMDEFELVRRNINHHRPHVDEIVIIDGYGKDGTNLYCKNRGDIKYFLEPFQDDFPAQRNKYLEKVPIGDWVLVVDPDEFITIETLQKLRQYINSEPRDKPRGFYFRSIDVVKKGEEEIYRSNSDFTKMIFFQKTQGTFYDSANNKKVHEWIKIPGAQLHDTDGRYIHEKQKWQTCINGARNFHCGGGGLNWGARNPYWVEYLDILYAIHGKKLSWQEMKDYMVKGNIDTRLKEWMLKYRKIGMSDGNKEDYCSEMRELGQYYFVFLHSEESAPEIKEEYRQQGLPA